MSSIKLTERELELIHFSLSLTLLDYSECPTPLLFSSIEQLMIKVEFLIQQQA